jgi:hypothetical protein
LRTGFQSGMTGRDSGSWKSISETEEGVVSAGVKAENDVKGIVRSMEKMSVENQDSREEGWQRLKHFFSPRKRLV